MKCPRLFCIVVLAAYISTAKAQLNIIENGGFELYSACPNGYSTFFPQITYALGWKQPTFGTADYFNTCAYKDNDAGVPKNYFGYQNAHSGKAYAGILTFIDQVAFQPNLSREYIQTRLSRVMKAGRQYYFEMYVSLADRNTYRYTINNMGAYVSKDEIKRPDADAFQYTPQVVSSGFLTDTSDWMKISGVFTAGGNEQYITLGRFGPNDPATISNIPGDGGNLFSYYYIDDVKLIDSCSEMDDVTTGILGSDTDFCSYTALYKTANAFNTKTKDYLWSTGQTTSSINITVTGTYWVKMSNGNCVNYDTIQVLNTPKVEIGLARDTAICFNKAIIIRPKVQTPAYTYKWMIDTSNRYVPAGNNPFLSINHAGKAILELGYNGCKNRDTITIYKSAMDALSLINDTIMCRKAVLILNATTPGAKTYKWSTQETTPAIYTESPVTKIYWAEISDGYCKSRDSVTVTLIGSKPQPRDTSFCKGSTLTLNSDPAASSILWSTGVSSYNLIVTTPGLYTLSQIKSGCTIIDTINVVSDSIPEISLGPDTTICKGSVLNMLVLSPYADHYLWNDGDTNAYMVASAAGQYSVTLSNRSCVFSDTVNIYIQQPVPFTLGPDTVDCFNTPFRIAGPAGASRYTWNDGSSDSVLLAHHAGTYWLTTINGSCINSDTIVLQQQPKPLINLGNDTTICAGERITLDAGNAGCVFSWNDASVGRQLTVNDSGIYSVKATNITGCWSIDSILIRIHPLTIALTHTTEVLCKDSVHTIMANPNMRSYTWQDGSTQASLTVHSPGVFTVHTTDMKGCAGTDSILIEEKERPEVLTQTFYEICEPDFYAETSIPYNNYAWQDGSSLSSYHIQDYGFYSLTVTDSNNCWNTAAIEVKQKCLPSVEVPNVFSPNGDGKNDRVIIDYKYMLHADLMIYNRWGQLLFQTKELNSSWDGTTPDGEAESGIYYYVLKCVGNENIRIEKTGTITLIR